MSHSAPSPSSSEATANVKVRRALISVSDKTGVVDLARSLARHGVEILSTGGTAKALRDAGLSVKDVSEHTGFPEMMDGRVKTLHPKVHGGLLALRDNKEHMAAASTHGIGMIDLVCVNLYPFERTVAKPGVERHEAIEQIDIGGPSMVRSAAKNHGFVAILTDPAQYAEVMAEMDLTGGATSMATRRKLAVAAYRATAAYDTAISTWLARHEAGEAEFTPTRVLRFNLRESLRYGENPHQSAAFYADPEWQGASLASARQVSGKELSYNNILDMDAALRLVMEFEEPAAVVVKHTNPCGCAIGGSIGEAFVRAYEGDPLSAFGGIVALNRPCDAATARAMCEGGKFLECVVAPGFDAEGIEQLVEKNPNKWKKSIRLVDVGALTVGHPVPDMRTVTGGVLIQSRDTQHVRAGDLKLPTKAKPDDAMMRELLFAWSVVKHVKSNAICLTKGRQLLGAGAGQMSRVDSVEIALKKAGIHAKGAALASDAFFPFPDSIELAAKAGVTAIIQPGGSVKDAEVVAACDKHGISMVLTGMRHFRH